MPGPRKGYTTPHRCTTVDTSRKNQPSDRDRKARQKLQEKTTDFHVNFHACVYLSFGPEAKRDIYNTFDPDKPFNVHLDPPSNEHPPLVDIKQEGKASICGIVQDTQHPGCTIAALFLSFYGRFRQFWGGTLWMLQIRRVSSYLPMLHH